MNNSKLCAAGSIVETLAASAGGLDAAAALAAQRRDDGPLGINTELSSPAGCVGAVSPSPPDYSKRFTLQAAARDLLGPDHRITGCCRHVLPDAGGVPVYHVPAYASGAVGQVMVCGNSWACSVCGPKIAERKRKELSAAVAAHRGRIFLVTFTLQHMKDDDLASLLADLKHIRNGLTNGKSAQMFRDRFDVLGTVQNWEVTYSDRNGFHPHIHGLYFVAPDTDIVAFTDAIKQRYLSRVRRVGRYASEKYGVDVRFASKDIADYIAKFGRDPKWTVAHELTKNTSKSSRNADGLTMDQLLARYAYYNDLDAGALWLQYVEVFRGSSRLHWSRGLRAALGLSVVEQTDQELAEQVEDDGVVLVVLTRYEWGCVCAHDARAELLGLAARGDVGAVLDFVVRLVMYSGAGGP